MASIETGIELHDGFSKVMEHIINVVDMAVGQMEAMQQTMNRPINTGAVENMGNQAGQAAAAYNELANSIRTAAETAEAEIVPKIPQAPDISPVNPEPVNRMPYPETIEQEVIQRPVVVSQPRAPPISPEIAEVPVQLIVTAQPEIEIPEEISVPVIPEVTEQPEIKIPEGAAVPITAVVTEQPMIKTPDEMTVPIIPEVTAQPEIKIPEELSVPVIPEVVAQPEIEIPEEISVPVIPEITEQPEINTLDEIAVPVIPEVTEQPEINIPESVTVPIEPVIANHPEIKTPDRIPVPVEPIVTAQPQIETPDHIEVPVDVSVTGVDTEAQEINGITARLNEVAQMQEAIQNTASSLYVLPDGSADEIRKINGEITQMQAALEFLKENPFAMDSSVAQLQIQSISEGLEQLTVEQEKLDAAMGNLPSQHLRVTVDAPDPLIEPPQPVRVPIEWQTEPLEVYTGSGIERFQQEAESANQMLSRLSSMQTAIAKQAYNTDILPPKAFQDMNRMVSRINLVQQRILQLENNPINIGTDQANTELEQLRSQLSQALQAQNQLNEAMEHMDAGEINASYLRLSQTIGNTERYIRDNISEQGRFNQELQEGVQRANGLTDMIKRVAGAYLGIQGMKNALNLSDTMTQTTARLSLIVDDGGSVEELQNKIFASAQNSRGLYMATADAVSKLGMQAASAFSSNDELIGFTELLNKSFVNAGTSMQGVDSVMLQLTQSMAAGKLQGEELNAVLDNAAPIVQNIQQYLEEVQGIDASNIKQLASDGVITAQVIKDAMFYAADDINAKFESMPMTWGQIWSSMQNSAMMAFQPVLQRINDIANTEGFQVFVDRVVNGLAALANMALNVFDLLASMGNFVADNWSVISPIVYGIVGALAVYAAYLGILKAMELASAAAKGVLAAAEFVHVAAVSAQTGATISATVAQMGLNGAMYACPIVWIIMLVIALIAVLFAVCSAIAKMTGVAQTGFGVITGGVMVIISFFWQLLSAVITIFGAVGAAAGALGHNMIAAFHNSIANVQTFFYNLLSTAMSVISKIASALSKLPFVEFDASGLAGAADAYAAKAQAAQDSKMEYEDIGAAFSSEMSKMTAFSDGWASDAFQKGAVWGDGVAEKISDFSLTDVFGGSDLIPNIEDYTKGMDGAVANGIADSGIADNSGSTAGNTAKMADTLSASEEDLKYLRDIAERDTVNRFTTAEITVNQTNHNNINSNMDVDGMIERMTEGMTEAIEITEEGVHE